MIMAQKKMAFYLKEINLRVQQVVCLMLCALMLACTSRQAINTNIDKFNMSLIAGEWEGEYGSEFSGKTGSITFLLTPGEDNAFGQVFMSERMGIYTLQRPTIKRITYPLAINFVQIANGRVSGQVAPYLDKEHNQTIHTIFEGRVNQDVMEGTYTSSIEGSNKSYTGSWRVVRKK